MSLKTQTHVHRSERTVVRDTTTTYTHSGPQKASSHSPKPGRARPNTQSNGAGNNHPSTSQSNSSSQPRTESKKEGDGDFKSEQLRAMAEDRQFQKDMFELQRISNRNALESTTMSNISKAHHDAMMAIAGNLK
jgi:hypothetical protein